MQLARQLGDVPEEVQGLLHGHLQHVVDALALVLHFQGFPVVAVALAHVAGDVHVRQKVHLNADDAVALAGLAPAALYVKGEAAGGKAPHFRVLGGGEQLPDVVEQPGVGGRVGAGRAANGGLVDLDDLVQMLQAPDFLVLAWVGVGAV